MLKQKCAELYFGQASHSMSVTKINRYTSIKKNVCCRHDFDFKQFLKSCLNKYLLTLMLLRKLCP